MFKKNKKYFVINFELGGGIIFVLKLVQDVLKRNLSFETIFYFFKTIIDSLIQKGMLWHFWYFGALIIVYLCLFVLNNKKKELKKIWIFFLIIGIIFQMWSYIIKVPIQSYCIQTFRIWTWLQYFILGGIIGKNYTNKKINTNMLHFLIIMSVYIFYQRFIVTHVLREISAEYFYDSIITILFCSYIFYFIINLKLKNITINFVKKVAPLTMGIYILHPIILSVSNKIIHVDCFFTAIIYFVSIFIISAICSLIMLKIPVVNKLIRL